MKINRFHNSVYLERENRDMEKMQSEQGVNLGWDDAEYKIDYDKMMETVQSSHPVNSAKQFYTCSEVCKETQTGSHTCCFDTTATTEFD